jgi:hypothetical protein
MAKIDCPYQEHLNSAKRHCLLSLLDYADLLKESKKDVPSAIELVKKRIHNDIAQFGQIASNLLSLAKSGGEITPLGEGNGKNGK